MNVIDASEGHFLFITGRDFDDMIDKVNRAIREGYGSLVNIFLDDNNNHVGVILKKSN